jgi:hypothetical protein
VVTKPYSRVEVADGISVVEGELVDGCRRIVSIRIDPSVQLVRSANRVQLMWASVEDAPTEDATEAAEAEVQAAGEAGWAAGWADGRAAATNGAD